MKDKMNNLIEKLWDIIYQGAQVYSYDKSHIKYNRESKSTFENVFVDLYEKIARDYMQEMEEPLDRHKVAAITMISVIKAKVLECNKIEEDDVFLGNYILATDSGLTYMLGEMNKRLDEKKGKEVKGYVFPEAMACETIYYKIFYRNLYFADSNNEWGLNPLDIAERLFLLEYITLEKNGIDPSILKEY